MPLDQNLHQTVTRFGCVGFSMYACGFSVPQMRQFCMHSYPPRPKWPLSEKMIFFFLPKLLKIMWQYFPALSKRIHIHIRFGGRIKLIICQIRHELSVTIHEISISREKKTLDGGPNIKATTHVFFSGGEKIIERHCCSATVVWDFSPLKNHLWDSTPICPMVLPGSISSQDES